MSGHRKRAKGNYMLLVSSVSPWRRGGSSAWVSHDWDMLRACLVLANKRPLLKRPPLCDVEISSRGLHARCRLTAAHASARTRICGNFGTRLTVTKMTLRALESFEPIPKLAGVIHSQQRRQLLCSLSALAQTIEPGAILLTCRGLTVSFDAFRLWRDQVRDIFDKPMQLAYNVYQILSVVQEISLNHDVLQEFLTLFPSSDEIASGVIPQAKLQNAAEAVDAIVELFPECLPDLGFRADDLVRVKLILDSNSHNFGYEGCHMACFSSIAVGLNHSCYPNTSMTIDSECRATVTATRTILPGEFIVHSYVPECLPGETGTLIQVSAPRS
jgi:hypothetical protein